MVCCHRAHSAIEQIAWCTKMSSPSSAFSSKIHRHADLTVWSQTAGQVQTEDLFCISQIPMWHESCPSLYFYLKYISQIDRRTASSLLHSRSHLKMPQAYRGNTRNSFVRLFETKQPKFQWSVNNVDENKSWRMTNSISSILKLVFEWIWPKSQIVLRLQDTFKANVWSNFGRRRKKW